MGHALSLNPVVQLREMFEGLPDMVRRPIEMVVFGGDLPRADIARMRWMAAELRDKAAAMNDHALSAGMLLAQQDSLGMFGDQLREALRSQREGGAKLRERALALADQTDGAANDAEKTLCVMFTFGIELGWRIMRMVSAAAAAGPVGEAAAAPAVEAALTEGRAEVEVMRVGLKQAYERLAVDAATKLSAVGPVRFAVTVGRAALLPTAVDGGVQLLQVEAGYRHASPVGDNGENPNGIDVKSILAAAASGAGGAVGGTLAARVAPGVTPMIQTSRTLAGLVHGMAGAAAGLGAAAMITGWPEDFDHILAPMLNGAFAGTVHAQPGSHTAGSGPATESAVDGSGLFTRPDLPAAAPPVEISAEAKQAWEAARQASMAAPNAATTESQAPVPNATANTAPGAVGPTGPARPGSTPVDAASGGGTTVPAAPIAAPAGSDAHANAAAPSVPAGAKPAAPPKVSVDATPRAADDGQPTSADAQSLTRPESQAAAPDASAPTRGATDAPQHTAGQHPSAGNARDRTVEHGPPPVVTSAETATPPKVSVDATQHGTDVPATAEHAASAERHPDGNESSRGAPRVEAGAETSGPQKVPADNGEHAAPDDSAAATSDGRRAAASDEHGSAAEHETQTGVPAQRTPADAEAGPDTGPTAPPGDKTGSSTTTSRDHAEDVLADFHARSGDHVPEVLKLSNLPDEVLQAGLFHPDEHESLVAGMEIIRRGTIDEVPGGMVLRAPQLEGRFEMAGRPVQMLPGQGKTLMFMSYSLNQAVRHGSALLVTTADGLAHREFTEYRRVLSRYGIDVLRADQETGFGSVTPGRPAIVVATGETVGHLCNAGHKPPRRAVIDEMDAIVDRGEKIFIQSEGTQDAAPEATVREVFDAHDFLTDAVAKGQLSHEDFGLKQIAEEVDVERADGTLDIDTEYWYDGRAELTPAGRAKLEALPGGKRWLDGMGSSRLEMAAAAEFTSRKKTHYVIDQGKIVIIDQAEHGLQRNPKTSSESRWSAEPGKASLAQAVEAKEIRAAEAEGMNAEQHGIVVRADADSSKSITAAEIYGTNRFFDHITGASGTLDDLGGVLKMVYGLDAPHKIDPYNPSQLVEGQADLHENTRAKLNAVAGYAHQMWDGGNGRFQEILCHRNDLVEKQVRALLRAGVPREAIEAVDNDRIAKWGADSEAELQKVFDAAGEQGKILVINRQGQRGVDIAVSDAVLAKGGMHVWMTEVPEQSYIYDQAKSRTARNGKPGTAQALMSPQDELIRNAMHLRGVREAVVQYNQAVAQHQTEPTPETHNAVVEASDKLGSLVPGLQQRAHHHATADFLLHNAPITAPEALIAAWTPWHPGNANIGPPDQLVDRSTRLARLLGIPAPALTAAAVLDQVPADTHHTNSEIQHAALGTQSVGTQTPSADGTGDPLQRMLHEANLSPAVVAALRQQVDATARAAAIQYALLTDEQALEQLTLRRDELAQQLDWSPEEVEGAEGLRQVGIALAEAQHDLANTLGFPPSDITPAIARDIVGEAVAQHLSDTGIHNPTGDVNTNDTAAREADAADLVAENAENVLAAASYYLATAALLDLITQIHLRSPNNCVNNGVTAMRVLCPKNKDLFTMPTGGLPLRGHDWSTVQESFRGGIPTTFGSLDKAVESLKERPGGIQVLVYKWKDTDKDDSDDADNHLVLVVNDSEPGDPAKLVVIDLAADENGNLDFAPHDLADPRTLLNSAVKFDTWQREQQKFIDKLPESKRAFWTIDFEPNGDLVQEPEKVSVSPEHIRVINVIGESVLAQPRPFEDEGPRHQPAMSSRGSPDQPSPAHPADFARMGNRPPDGARASEPEPEHEPGSAATDVTPHIGAATARLRADTRADRPDWADAIEQLDRDLAEAKQRERTLQAEFATKSAAHLDIHPADRELLVSSPDLPERLRTAAGAGTGAGAAAANRADSLEELADTAAEHRLAQRRLRELEQWARHVDRLAAEYHSGACDNLIRWLTAALIATEPADGAEARRRAVTAAALRRLPGTSDSEAAPGGEEWAAERLAVPGESAHRAGIDADEAATLTRQRIEQVHRWWTGLTDDELPEELRDPALAELVLLRGHSWLQSTLVRQHPGLLGTTTGVPTDARRQANVWAAEAPVSARAARLIAELSTAAPTAGRPAEVSVPATEPPTPVQSLRHADFSTGELEFVLGEDPEWADKVVYLVLDRDADPVSEYFATAARLVEQVRRITPDLRVSVVAWRRGPVGDSAESLRTRELLLRQQITADNHYRRLVNPAAAPDITVIGSDTGCLVAGGTGLSAADGLHTLVMVEPSPGADIVSAPNPGVAVHVLSSEDAGGWLAAAAAATLFRMESPGESSAQARARGAANGTVAAHLGQQDWGASEFQRLPELIGDVDGIHPNVRSVVNDAKIQRANISDGEESSAAVVRAGVEQARAWAADHGLERPDLLSADVSDPNRADVTLSFGELGVPELLPEALSGLLPFAQPAKKVLTYVFDITGDPATFGAQAMAAAARFAWAERRYGAYRIALVAHLRFRRTGTDDDVSATAQAHRFVRRLDALQGVREEPATLWVEGSDRVRPMVEEMVRADADAPLEQAATAAAHGDLDESAGGPNIIAAGALLVLHRYENYYRMAVERLDRELADTTPGARTVALQQRRDHLHDLAAGIVAAVAGYVEAGALHRAAETEVPVELLSAAVDLGDFERHNTAVAALLAASRQHYLLADRIDMLRETHTALETSESFHDDRLGGLAPLRLDCSDPDTDRMARAASPDRDPRLPPEPERLERMSGLIGFGLAEDLTYGHENRMWWLRRQQLLAQARAAGHDLDDTELHEHIEQHHGLLVERRKLLREYFRYPPTDLPGGPEGMIGSRPSEHASDGVPGPADRPGPDDPSTGPGEPDGSIGTRPNDRDDSWRAQVLLAAGALGVDPAFAAPGAAERQQLERLRADDLREFSRQRFAAGDRRLVGKPDSDLTSEDAEYTLARLDSDPLATAQQQAVGRRWLHAHRLLTAADELTRPTRTRQPSDDVLDQLATVIDLWRMATGAHSSQEPNRAADDSEHVATSLAGVDATTCRALLHRNDEIHTALRRLASVWGSAYGGDGPAVVLDAFTDGVWQHVFATLEPATLHTLPTTIDNAAEQLRPFITGLADLPIEQLRAYALLDLQHRLLDKLVPSLRTQAEREKRTRLIGSRPPSDGLGSAGTLSSDERTAAVRAPADSGRDDSVSLTPRNKAGAQGARISASTSGPDRLIGSRPAEGHEPTNGRALVEHYAGAADPGGERGFLDLEIHDQIRVLEHALGITSEAERALELALFMEDTYREVVLVSGQERPQDIFDGPEGWAGWLDARVFARSRSEQALSVEFLAEIHRRLAVRVKPECAGRFRGDGDSQGGANIMRAAQGVPLTADEISAVVNNPRLTYVPEPYGHGALPYGFIAVPRIDGVPGARTLRFVSSPLSDEELADLLSDPLAGFERPTPRSVRLARAAFIIYPWYGSVAAMRDELAQLCARYNEAIAEPGYNPYQVAADLQQGQISVHPFSTDFNGRASRVALCWSLGRAGQPPSALPSFNKDMFSSPAEWAEQVRQGSVRYRKWEARVESDPTLDPVALFELESVRQRYRALGGTDRPFPPGNYFTGRVVAEFHRVLRSSAPLDEFAALDLSFFPTGPPVITELTHPGTADQAFGDGIGRRPHEGTGRDSSDFLKRGRTRIHAAWAGMGPLRSTHFPPPGRRMTTNAPDINAALWSFSLWMAHVANQGLNGLSGQWDSADTPEAKREVLTQLYFWISNQRYLRQVWAVARDPNIVGIDGKKDPEYFRTRFSRGVNDGEMYGDLVWLRAGIERDYGTGQWHGGVGTQAFWTASAIGRILRARMRNEAEDPAVLVNTVELPDGTRVEGNVVRRFDRDKFAIETASASDQQVIFDAAITELATRVAPRSPNPSSDTLRRFANVVYLLFQAPLIIGGSDATIRMFAAATMTFAFGRPVRLPHDLDSQAKARNQSDFIAWFIDILTRRLGATGPASESARPHLIGPPSAELFARGVQALGQQRTSIELQPGSDIEQWVAGRGLGVLSGPHAVEDAFTRASRDLLQEEGLSEVRRPEGPVRRSVVKRAIAARLRIIAGFTDPDFSRAYPDNLYGDNRDIRRDNATALQRIAHKLETDPKYSLTDVLEEAREHAFHMQAKYEGFRGQQVIRPGTQPWSLSTITENLTRRLPEGVGPDAARDVIDAVIRIAELVSSTSADGYSAPGTDADAAIVLTVNEGADRQLRLCAQLDYNAHGTPPNPAMLNLALAGANCQCRVEESRPLSVTEPHPRHRVLLDFSSPITDTGRDWTEVADRPAGPVMVPITVGHDTGAVARRARFLIRGELGGTAYIARFAPVVGELINRCRASDVEVRTERRGDSTALGIRAGNWVLDLQTAGSTTLTVVRISFPTVVRDDLRAVLIALLPEAPRFAEALVEEAPGFAPGELTIAVTGEPGGRTVEFMRSDHLARRVVRTEPANNPVGSAVLDSSARSAGPAVHDIAEPPVTADTRIPILGTPESTQDTAPPINVHICTKDGPQRLNEIISDIASVIPAVDAVFVYDDSVDLVNRAHNRLALKSAPFRTVYIDEPRRRELLRNLPWPDEAAESYARYAFKELGRAEWNHAGIRGLAHFVAAATAAPGSRVLFLDDDVRLSEGTFQGKVYQVDSEAVADLLSRPISDDRVVGAEYVGRADVYDAEHAKHALASDSAAGHQTNYRFVPAYDGGEREEALEGAVPITGAFLLLDDQGVRRVPIPHTYNEDIAFIAVLQAHGYRIEVAPFKPLHTGDEKRMKWRTAFIQQVGVVIQKSLEQALEEVGVDDLQALADRVIGYCDRNAEMAAEIWKELFRDPDRQFGEVHSRNVYALVDTERIAREAGTALAAYLRSWSGWRKLVDDPAVSAYVRRAAHSTFGTEPAAAHRAFEVVDRQADRSPGTDQVVETFGQHADQSRGQHGPDGRLVASRDGDWDPALIRSLRALPAQGADFKQDRPNGQIGSRPSDSTPKRGDPTRHPSTVMPPGAAPAGPEGIIGARPPESDAADERAAQLLRGRAELVEELRTVAALRGEETPAPGAEASALDAWHQVHAEAATTIATLIGADPGLVSNHLNDILDLLLRRLNVLTRSQWDQLLANAGQQRLTGLGSWISRRLLLEDDIQRATALAIEGTPDTELNKSNTVGRAERSRELDDIFGHSTVAPGEVVERDTQHRSSALDRLAATTDPTTPTGRLLAALVDHQQSVRLIQLTNMRAEMDRVIAEHLGRGNTTEPDGPAGTIGSRPPNHEPAPTPDSSETFGRAAVDQPGVARQPEQQSSLIDGAGTGRRSDADMARETPEVEKIEALRGRPGVKIELMTFEDGVQVLRETYRYAEHAMREWAQALICRAMGAPIAEVRLSPPEFHVLYRDYQYEGASRDQHAADLLGISAAITGKKSPFAAAFVRYVDGRKVWQEHHLPRQAIADIGQVVMYAGDLLEQIALPEPLSRVVLNTQRAAMDSLREIAQHAENPLRMARLDDEAQAKTRLIENFVLRHPYLELAGFDSPHVPKETVEEILAKLDDLLDRYRHAPGFRMLMTNIRKLRIDFLFGARATTGPELDKHGEELDGSTVRAELTFSLQYAADRNAALADNQRRLERGILPSSEQPYADDVLHEFAHAIDRATGDELSRNLTAMLRTAHAQLKRRGLIESYAEWLSRLPSYAFTNVAGQTTLREDEALAVGFSDAEINGNVVGTPRWVIHEYVANLQPPHVESARFIAHPDLPEGLIGSRPPDDPSSDVRSRTARGPHSQQPDRVEPASAATDPYAPASEKPPRSDYPGTDSPRLADPRAHESARNFGFTRAVGDWLAENIRKTETPWARSTRAADRDKSGPGRDDRPLVVGDFHPRMPARSHSEQMVIFGEWLAAVRTLHGLTQQQLADAMGISRQTVGEAERGTRITVDYMRGFGRVIGFSDDVLRSVSPRHLARFFDRTVPDPRDRDLRTFGDWHRAVRTFRGMNRRQLAEAMGVSLSAVTRAENHSLISPNYLRDFGRVCDVPDEMLRIAAPRASEPGPLGRPRAVTVGISLTDRIVEYDEPPGMAKYRAARSIRRTPGAKALNQAVALARLGAEVEFVSTTGLDEDGAEIRERLRREGIGHDGIRIEDGISTGMVECIVEPDGEWSYIDHLSPELDLTSDDIRRNIGAIENADVVLLTFTAPDAVVAHVASVARENGATVVLQPAPARDQFSFDTVRMADILVPNEAEARALLTAAGATDAESLDAHLLPDRLFDLLGVPIIVVTLGAAGCAVRHQGRTRMYEAHSTSVVDTTGASDAFTAALAMGVLAGLPVDHVVEIALSAAAHAVAHSGGHESMPYAHDLDLSFIGAPPEEDEPTTSVAPDAVAPVVPHLPPTGRAELLDVLDETHTGSGTSNGYAGDDDARVESALAAEKTAAADPQLPVDCLVKCFERIVALTGSTAISPLRPGEIGARGVFPLAGQRASGGVFRAVGSWDLLERRVLSMEPGATFLIGRQLVDSESHRISLSDTGPGSHFVTLSHSKEQPGKLELFDPADGRTRIYEFGLGPADFPLVWAGNVAVLYDSDGVVAPLPGQAVLPAFPLAGAPDEPIAGDASDDIGFDARRQPSAALLSAAPQEGVPSDLEFDAGRHTYDTANREAFQRWHKIRARNQEAGFATQSLAQYARMHDIDGRRIRRWLAEIHAEPDDAPDAPLPHPHAYELARDWARDVRRFLAVTRADMDVLTAASPGTWEAIETNPRPLPVDQIRALLRCVPDARHLYGPLSQVFCPDLAAAQPGDVGGGLRRLREYTGLTQEELARELGVIPMTINNREASDHLVRMGWEAHLRALAAHLSDAIDGDADIGACLRVLRLRTGLPRRHLAVKMGMAEETLADIEVGRSQPSKDIVEAALCSLVPGTPIFPEGYPHAGSYLRYRRERAGVLLSQIATATGMTEAMVRKREAGEVPLTAEMVERYLGDDDSDLDLRRDMLEVFPSLDPDFGRRNSSEYSIELFLFPGPRNTRSLVEYKDEFQRVNGLADIEVRRLFGWNPGRSPAVGADAALRVYDRFLRQAGHWNEFAVAWGYRYRMDPLGESAPDPGDFDSILDWKEAARLYHRTTARVFRDELGRRDFRGAYATEKQAGLALLDRLRAEGYISAAAMRRAAEQFHISDPTPRPTPWSSHVSPTTTEPEVRSTLPRPAPAAASTMSVEDYPADQTQRAQPQPTRFERFRDRIRAAFEAAERGQGSRALAESGSGSRALAESAEAELRRAVEQLTRDLRRVLVLRFWEGLSVAATAAAMGHRTDTVELLQRAAVRALVTTLTAAKRGASSIPARTNPAAADGVGEHIPPAAATHTPEPPHVENRPPNRGREVPWSRDRSYRSAVTREPIRAGALFRADSKPGYVIDGIRRFDSDRLGAMYGEQYLSSAFRDLPDDQRAAVLECTFNSYAYQSLLRPTGIIDPSVVERKLKEFYSDTRDGWSLFELYGSVPTLDDIYRAASQADLTSVQRGLVSRIISSEDPWRELQKTIRRPLSAGMRGTFTATFGKWPTVADIQERITLINRAVQSPLPEGLEVHRALREAAFMMAGDSPYELVGTTWIEPGFSSTSLGKGPVVIADAEPTVELHILVPKGVEALWIGRNGPFPEQNELLFGQGLGIRITNVRKYGGKWHFYAKVIRYGWPHAERGHMAITPTSTPTPTPTTSQAQGQPT
ncbi:PfkB family carbohydrate kinase [Nocardia sp. NPDC050630]|uniref:PfkB family carbohydrate kinase n=1 Tax=Nocardia sp. NPDC050630 TaxID=3364321 RepID=UPI0037902442